MPGGSFASSIDLPPDFSAWLDAQSEARLIRKGKLGRDAACLSEEQLARLVRLDRRRAPFLDPPGLPRESQELAFELHLSYLIDLANLTPLQEACLRMRLNGLGYGLIARWIKRRRCTVFASVQSAFRRLRRSYQEGPYAGWYEVYVSEVTRRPMR